MTPISLGAVVPTFSRQRLPAVVLAGLLLAVSACSSEPAGSPAPTDGASSTTLPVAAPTPTETPEPKPSGPSDDVEQASVEGTWFTAATGPFAASDDPGCPVVSLASQITSCVAMQTPGGQIALVELTAGDLVRAAVIGELDEGWRQVLTTKPYAEIDVVAVSAVLGEFAVAEPVLVARVELADATVGLDLVTWPSGTPEPAVLAHFAPSTSPRVRTMAGAVLIDVPVFEEGDADCCPSAHDVIAIATDTGELVNRRRAGAATTAIGAALEVYDAWQRGDDEVASEYATTEVLSTLFADPPLAEDRGRLASIDCASTGADRECRLSVNGRDQVWTISTGGGHGWAVTSIR